MSLITRTTMVAMSLFLSAAIAFATDVKTAPADLKQPSKPPVEGAETDVKAYSGAAKEEAKTKIPAAKGVAKSRLIDINTATETELRTVPGLGETYSAKIIAGRPYANKTQLKSRKVLPSMLYEQVKEQLIAKQPRKK